MKDPLINYIIFDVDLTLAGQDPLSPVNIGFKSTLKNIWMDSIKIRLNKETGNLLRTLHPFLPFYRPLSHPTPSTSYSIQG